MVGIVSCIFNRFVFYKSTIRTLFFNDYSFFICPHLLACFRVYKRTAKKHKKTNLWHIFIPIIVITLVCLPGTPFLYLDKKDINYLQYGIRIFEESPLIVKEIEKLTSEGNYVFTTGMQPEINYYSRRKSPSRFFMTFHFMAFHMFLIII